MEFVPDSQAPASSGVDFEPATDTSLGPQQEAAAAAAAKPQVSTGKAFARGAVAGGTLGLFSLLNAAADTAGQKLLPQPALDFIQQHGGGGEGLPVNEPHTFGERRQAYQGLLHQAQEAHPKAYLAGEAAGSLAAPVPGTSGAGAAVAEKLGGNLAARVAGTGVSAGIAGAELGAGSAIGEGKSAPDVLKEAGKGALAGAITGSALHGTAGLTGMVTNKALQSLSDKYVALFGSEVVGGRAVKSTATAFTKLANREDEAGVKAAQNYIKSKELAPVESAAAKGFYQDAADQVEQRIQKLSPARQANYQTVFEAKPFRVGDGEDALKAKLFQARNSGAKGEPNIAPLEKALEGWRIDFATADASIMQRLLESPSGVTPQVKSELASIAQELPKKGRIGRDQWLEAVKSTNASPAAQDYMTKLEGLKYGQEKGAEGLFKYDPEATTDPLRLRAEATARASSASAAFDALTPQFSQGRKEAISKAINGALERYLDQAAATSQEAAAAVKRIRSDDVKWSVLLNAKEALKKRVADQMVKENLQAQGAFNKPHITIPGIALAGAGAAYRGAIRAAPRLQERLAGLPSTSPLAQQLAQRVGIAASAVANQQSTQPQPITGTTSFGTGNQP